MTDFDWPEEFHCEGCNEPLTMVTYTEPVSIDGPVRVDVTCGRCGVTTRLKAASYEIEETP